MPGDHVALVVGVHFDGRAVHDSLDLNFTEVNGSNFGVLWVAVARETEGGSVLTSFAFTVLVFENGFLVKIFLCFGICVVRKSAATGGECDEDPQELIEVRHGL